MDQHSNLLKATSVQRDAIIDHQQTCACMVSELRAHNHSRVLSHESPSLSRSFTDIYMMRMRSFQSFTYRVRVPSLIYMLYDENEEGSRNQRKVSSVYWVGEGTLV